MGRGFGGANVHAFENQGGVNTDDFSAALCFKMRRHCQSQASFTTGGRSGNGKREELHALRCAMIGILRTPSQAIKTKQLDHNNKP